MSCRYIRPPQSDRERSASIGAAEKRTANPGEANGAFGSFESDGFVTKARADGSAWVYSTLIGGNQPDGSVGIAVDQKGTAFIAGQTRSDDFPTVDPLQVSRSGRSDGFVARLSSGVPLCEIELTQSVYGTGDTVRTAIFWLTNPELQEQSVEVKIWLEKPGLPPVAAGNGRRAEEIVLPSGFANDFGPTDVLWVSPDTPRGLYGFHCRILDPVTGDTLLEDRNPFRVE